jgi:hypothetical protein
MSFENLTETDQLSIVLLSDFYAFCRYFYPLLNGRPYDLLPHRAVVMDALVDVYLRKNRFLNVNVHPGSGKSTQLSYFVAWTIARDPRVTHLYTAYSQELAIAGTTTVFEIVSLPIFTQLFNVRLSPHTASKTHFKTTEGGVTRAASIGGAITGFSAGFYSADPNLYVGGLIIDDPIKPEEAFSRRMREKVESTYFSTLETRLRSQNASVVCIAQRTHEHDLSSVFLKNKDGNKWRNIVIPFLSEDGKVIDEEIMPLEKFNARLKNIKTSYGMHAQYLQNPIAIGETFFDVDDFKVIDTLPPIKRVFMTIDCAETDKISNDATAMSAWGVYDLKVDGVDFKQEALVWLDCKQIWVMPNDLMTEFMSFYSRVFSRFGVIDSVHIETKSMGTMLFSNLSAKPGIRALEIKRSTKMSKSDRMGRAQPFVKRGLISIVKEEPHYYLVTNHMAKITPTKSHQLDDIADTMADAVEIMLLHTPKVKKDDNFDIVKSIRVAYGCYG